MNRFAIKIESLAKRCEICHQMDCFDADTNFCSRCVDIALNADDLLATKETLHHYSNIGLISGLLIGALLGIINEFANKSSFVQLSPWLVIIGISLIGSIWGTMIGAGIENLQK